MYDMIYMETSKPVIVLLGVYDVYRPRIESSWTTNRIGCKIKRELSNRPIQRFKVDALFEYLLPSRQGC